jgi:methylmalonyl-CoA/ethylmalonyl-CoA epimerase
MVKIDHIGIAVKSLEDSTKVYESLGLKNMGVESLKDEEVNVCVFEATGCRIELLEPMFPDSIVAKFIEKRGEGKRLGEIGIKPIGNEIRKGVGGSKISFLHPRNFKGVLIELVER